MIILIGLWFDLLQATQDILIAMIKQEQRSQAAVPTSIVSTAWRYFTIVSIILLDCTMAFPCSSKTPAWIV